MSKRREDILRVAAVLFAERGFVATTVRDIADEAGILSGSLYHHFRSKSEMAEEIVGAFFAALIDRYRQVICDANDPGAALEAMVREAFTSIEGHRTEITIVQRDWAHFESCEWFAEVARASDEIEAMWVEVLVTGARAGALRSDVDPALIYRFVRDAVWMTVRWYRPDRGASIADIADSYLTLLLDGLRVGDAGAVRARPGRRAAALDAAARTS